MTFSIDKLHHSIDTLPKVGAYRAQKLATLSIYTINDLLHYYPFRYEDLSLQTSVNTLQEGETVTLTGTISSIATTYTKSGKTLQKATFEDPTGSLVVTWFNQPYLVKYFHSHPNISLSGKVTRYHGHLTLVSPQFENYSASQISPLLRTSDNYIHTGRLVPVYHETEGISSKWLRSMLKPLLDNLDDSIEFLPQSIYRQYQLITLTEALKKIHFPHSNQDILKAKERLSFDELLILQLAAQIRKQGWQSKTMGLNIKPYNTAIQAFISQLPFTLTPGQQQAVQDIISDLKKPTAMNRLLQGDVGSGKTVVAAIAIYVSYLNHLPAVVLAPTEILAQQHFKTLKKLFSSFHLTLALHTLKETVVTPQADVIIGTHALLFRQLPDKIGLIVIDEQHRFGVAQRAAIVNRPTPPNVLSMTATPIPRTVALTLYAELDISLITDMPAGRIPVKTWLVPLQKRHAAELWLSQQIESHQAQIFIVCPLIKDSVAPLLDQVKAVESEYLRLKKVFPRFRLGLLHGRLKATEKATVLQSFRDHQLDILVSTPVIEVGVDIPQATIMVIEAAERFGLAQLHQLRGRVGRSDKQSYCLLFTTQSRSPKRLSYLPKVHSGIQLAELDLKLRGPGEMYGTLQSGYLDFKIASLFDQTLITRTYTTALDLLSQDPQLNQFPKLREKLIPHLAKRTLAN